MKKLASFLFIVTSASLVQADATGTSSVSKPNDPLYHEQERYLQTIGMEILLQSQTAATTVADFVVVTIDTGVDCTHPDLAMNVDMVHSKSFAGGNPCVDDFAPNTPYFGHGTKVAGFITAQSDNGIGIAGVGARLVAFQTASKSFNGIGDPHLAALQAVRNLPHKLVIVNASFITGDYPAMREAIAALKDKALIVAGAGNNLRDAGAEKYWPCSASNLFPHVVCVGGLGYDNRLSAWANYGSVVNLVAPADLIMTTSPGGGYEKVSGTSFATSLVTGLVAAVVKQALVERTPISDITPAMLKEALLAGAKFNPFLLESYPLWQIQKPHHAWAPGMWRNLQLILSGQLVEPSALLPMNVVGINEALTGRREFIAGDWISIWGENFSDKIFRADIPPFPETLDNIQVLLNGKPLPLNYVSPNQINVLLPTDPVWLWPQPTQNTLILVRLNANGEVETDSAVLLPKFSVNYQR